MTLHRVTVAAFAALLVISGIGSLVARQGPASSVQPVELTEDSAETPPAAGGQVEEATVPDQTDDRATAPDAEPSEVLATNETLAEDAAPAAGTDDVAAQDVVDDPDEGGASDDDGEDDSDD